MIPPIVSSFVSEIDLGKLQDWADGWLSIMTLDIAYSRCQELEMSGKDEVSISREVASIRCDLQSAMSIGGSTVVCKADLWANERNHIRVAGKAEATEKEHWPTYPQTIRFSIFVLSSINFGSLESSSLEQKDRRLSHI